MHISFLKFIGLLIISALIMGLSFPFMGGVLPFAFIGFAPFILFNSEINKVKKFRGLKRFIGNYVYFLVYNIFTTWWIYNSSPEGGYMAFTFHSFLMTIPLFIYGFVHKHLGETKGFIALVVFWISFEHIDHVWDLSWPWLSFGNILGDSPHLIQWYEYSGIEGGTLWILLVNLFVFLIIRNIWVNKEKWKLQTPLVLLVGLTVSLPILSSLFMFYTYEEKIDPVNVVIVQPNIHPWYNSQTGIAGEKFTTPTSQQLDKILGLAESKLSASTDLIVCPETAISSESEEHSLDYLGSVMKLRHFSEDNFNIPFLIGADTYGMFSEKRPYPAQKRGNYWIENYNTALLIDANNPIDIYHKSKLVLGAEKLPFVDIFPFMAKLSVDLGGTNGILVANDEAKNFDAKGVKYAPLICYESVYGEFVSNFTAKGAEILCVITNDGWWHNSPGHKQHNMLSQIRAIENRRSIARSANTGISCVINQKGEIITRLDWDKEGAISATLNRNTDITFFVIYGDLLGRVSIFMALGLLLYSFVTMLKYRGVLPQKKKVLK
jgi:apolipoprotein N-acyltransferase